MQAPHTPLTLVVVDIIPNGLDHPISRAPSLIFIPAIVTGRTDIRNPLCLPQCGTAVKGAECPFSNAVVDVDGVVAAKSAFR